MENVNTLTLIISIIILILVIIVIVIIICCNQNNNQNNYQNKDNFSDIYCGNGQFGTKICCGKANGNNQEPGCNQGQQNCYEGRCISY